MGICFQNAFFPKKKKASGVAIDLTKTEKNLKKMSTSPLF